MREPPDLLGIRETLTAEGKPVMNVCSATLSIVRGPDAGREERIASPTFVVGGGSATDMRLSDPSVSREHLRLTLTSAGVRIRDCSKNGTRIGGLRIHDVVAQSDTVMTLGTTALALRLEAERLLLPLSEGTAFGDAFGSSPVMRHLFAILERAAQSDLPVLFEGESGVGKDVLARAVHQASNRRDGPFVVVDCGGLPSNLVESELFGHARGAFTGADTERRGLFDDAHGGTLFLDEVGELPLDVQPKFLRALETREIRPVGGKKARRIDVRVLCATNRKLAEAAKRGSFREDLYYRLAVARVTVPALRDRPEDVLPLATRFLHRAKGDDRAEIPADLAALLSEYSWPGNVRELKNVIERYAVLGDTASLMLLDPVVPGSGEDLSKLPYHEARRLVLERFEQDYVPKVLARADGVVARAAEQAQLARPSFYRLLERLRLADDR
jgi:DNA-binding NtrC family response regulator